MIRIDVTDADFREGEPSSPIFCPVALAVRRSSLYIESRLVEVDDGSRLVEVDDTVPACTCDSCRWGRVDESRLVEVDDTVRFKAGDWLVDILLTPHVWEKIRDYDDYDDTEPFSFEFPEFQLPLCFDEREYIPESPPHIWLWVMETVEFDSQGEIVSGFCV